MGGQDFDRVLQDEILHQLRETYQWTPSGAAQREEVRRLAPEMDRCASGWAGSWKI